MNNLNKPSERKKFSPAVLLFFWIAFVRGSSAEPASPSGGSNSTNAVEPRIQFESIGYDFGEVISGSLVRHDFVFTNTGDAALEITGVHPSCGCTKAGDWSWRVQPGKTGIIPLEFNSAKISGRGTKSATVTTTDKCQSALLLRLSGVILKPIEVTPEGAFLNIVADSPSNAPAILTITNRMDQPVRLSTSKSTNRAFVAKLKTLRSGKAFQLIVRARPLPMGTTEGVITIKTSSTNVPSIEIVARAIVKPAMIASHGLSLIR